MQKNIVYEDENTIILNKQPGTVVAGTGISSQTPELMSMVINYMKDKNERQAVSNLHYTKQLPYSKMITKVNMADDQYQLPSKQVVYRNIKMLEGILKATEQRVLVEMERNKELNEKNQQLQKQVEQLDHMIKQNRPSDELSKLEQESKKMQEEMRIYEKKMKNMELKRQLEQLKSNYNQASSKGAPPKKA